jgi:predicted nucleic acid-binding protein
MPAYSTVVIDAGVGVYTVVQGPVTAAVESQWKAWIKDGIRVRVPGLWLNEITSVLHKLSMQKLIGPDIALQALNAVLGLGVEVQNADQDMCRKAYEWATRLGQFQAYDGFYLALAEGAGAGFWTTDQRLISRSAQLGIDWVHGLTVG